MVGASTYPTRLGGLAGMPGGTWDGSTIRIELSLEYEQSPNIGTGNYVDVAHPNPALYKEGFFANSGVKIENRSEIQIYDTASLLNAVVGQSQETVDGSVETVKLHSGHDVNSAGTVKLDHGGGAWVPEEVSALITGIPYNNDNEYLGINPTEPYAGKTYLERLDLAPKGGLTMRIDVSRGAAPGGPYRFEIKIGENNFVYENVQRNGTTDTDSLYLQSHWGSGVKFTSTKVRKL